VLVHRAALEGTAVPHRRESLLQARRSLDNDKGSPHNWLNQIMEHSALGGLGLAAHVPAGQQLLPIILADADRHQERADAT
jgi:hypothetical protein